MTKDNSQLQEFVDKTFEGSVPAFIAAFCHSKKISEKETAELQALIEQYKE